MRLGARKARHLDVSEVIVFGVISHPSLDVVARVAKRVSPPSLSMRESTELLLTRCRAFVDWFRDEAVRGLLGEPRRLRYATHSH